MRIKNKIVLIIVALLLFVQSSRCQGSINCYYSDDYSSLYNKYSHLDKKHFLVASWLHNGMYVEKGFGHIGLPTLGDNTDTVPFIYCKGCMVFNEKDFNKLNEFCTANCQINEYRGSEITLSMTCLKQMQETDTLIVNKFETRFPSMWIVCLWDNSLGGRVFRITADNDGNYIVSVDTFGYYRSIHIEKERNIDRKIRQLLKTHIKIYGNT